MSCIPLTVVTDVKSLTIRNHNFQKINYKTD